MTPQPRQQTRSFDFKKDAQGAGPAPHIGRFSLGGQARRVIVEQPWKVHDLVLPPSTPTRSDSNPLMPIDPPSQTIPGFAGPSVASPWKNSSSKAGTPINENSIPAITEEERKAIQDRRKSAVREFNSTPFWAGGAPGMSPTKGSFMLSPNKPIGAASPSKKFTLGSPTKARTSNHVGTQRGDSQSKDDEDLDTSGLLDKIKETVNDMKRRRSVILGGNDVMGIALTPTTSEPEDLSTHDANPTEESPIRKVDFTKIGTPSKASKHTPKTSPHKNSVDNEEHTEPAHQEKPFSLLRPGALEGRRQSVVSTPLRKEQVVTVVPVPLITVEQMAIDTPEELPKETAARGHTRAVRSGNNVTEGSPDVRMEDDGSDTKVCLDSLNQLRSCGLTSIQSEVTKTDVSKPSGARLQRSRTAQPQTLSDSASDTVDVSQRASRSAARGKVTTADVALKHIPEETDTVEKPATRRVVRKAHTIDKGGEEVKPVQSAPKRGRPRKNPVPTEKSQSDTRLAGRSTSKVRSRTTPTNTKETETDSEDDPLDSYDIEGVPPPISAEEGNDLALDSRSTPDAQNKAKSQLPVTRGKATRNKQEEPREDSTLPIAATRVRRSAKVNTDSQMPDVTPAVKTGTGKTRGRPKTPATAPANTGTSVVEEKENTIGPRSKLKSTEKLANSEAEELPVKLRVSRSRAAASNVRNAAKAAEQDEEQPPPRQRATRVMRTRTKTG